jgi:hypothetical protein
MPVASTFPDNTEGSNPGAVLVQDSSLCAPHNRAQQPTRNPYLSGDSRWTPGATLALRSKVADLATLNGLDHLALEIVRFFAVPVLRRVLEATLVFDHGVTPDQVTKCLRRITTGAGHNVVYLQRAPFGQDVQLYSIGPPTTADMDLLCEAYRERERAIDINSLRVAGESYFRSVLIRSGRFVRVTNRTGLGCVDQTQQGRTLDIHAVDSETGIAYGISIKNQREALYPGNRAIPDVFARAKVQGLRPWLVVAFASEKAASRCSRDGIRLTVLGRQIVPALDPSGRHMKGVIERLRGVLGPQPFDYNYRRFSQTLKLSAHASRDVELVKTARGTPAKEPNPEVAPLRIAA